MEKKAISISDLAKEFGLDRATVTKRLAGMPFIRGAKNAKLYYKDEVEALLDENQASPELNEAKLRRAVAEAERQEILVAKLKGELVNRVEVLTELQEIVSRLYQTICVQYPRRNAGRLFKVKTSQELAQILQSEFMGIFEEVADEYSFTTSSTSGDTPQ